jgi:hypothetical protein
LSPRGSLLGLALEECLLAGLGARQLLGLLASPGAAAHDCTGQAAFALAVTQALFHLRSGELSVLVDALARERLPGG